MKRFIAQINRPLKNNVITAIFEHNKHQFEGKNDLLSRRVMKRINNNKEDETILVKTKLGISKKRIINQMTNEEQVQIFQMLVNKDR